MENLGKKLKLIEFIAILLVAVIIAIVITTSILRNNNHVANEGYAATSANAGSRLIANYILNGITIGGITGKMEVLNTNDATAVEEDILMGKTAYVKGEKITGTRMGLGAIIEPSAPIELNDIYYADIEGDGTVDGVIFADLAVGGSGKWGTNDYGTYEIPIESNLKTYYISQEAYTDDFGIGLVISPIEGTSGNNRFYVMALDDFDESAYSWNNSVVSDNLITGTENDFGEGKTNTEMLINKWNALSDNIQKSNDVWGIIQNAVSNGWFIPSKSEWAAFNTTFNISDNFR